MKYRKLDADGDMVFGHGNADYHRNSPQCVAQAVLTRLRLIQGEWFLDTRDGTPYVSSILGKHKRDAWDLAIQDRVRDTPGVKSIDEYTSALNGDNRCLMVAMQISTDYGTARIQEVL